MRIPTLLLTFTLLAVPVVHADFSYEQESKITGGAMAGAMKMASVFSKKASQPISSRTVYKGARSAQISEEQRVVTDMEAQTITTIFPKKKRYHVVTFEQMRQYMEKMTAKARRRSGDQQGQMDFSVKVNDTGKTRDFNGTTAREIDMRMQIQGQDPQTGESGAMEMLMKSWMADPAAGYDEVQNFYKQYGQKLNWMPGSAMAGLMGGQGNSQGMAELQKEAAKMKGMPLQQIVSMGAPGHQIGEKPAGGDAAEQESPGSMLKKGLGGLGGFGGFGKKKKQQDEQQAQTQPQSSGGSIMEMTITYKNYSNASVDPSLVDTAPAGYQRVKSDIEKALQ